MYGTTKEGGANNKGVLFKYNFINNSCIKIKDFNDTIGASPTGTMLSHNNKLYGLTPYGGVRSYGVLFEYDPAKNSLVKKQEFGSQDGNSPMASLTINKGKLYGTTRNGGKYDVDDFNNKPGVLFQVDTIPGGAIKTLSQQNSCRGNLTLFNGELYGVANKVYKWDPITNVQTMLTSNPPSHDPAYIMGSMIPFNNKFYGVSAFPSFIFEFDPLALSFTIKKNFTDDLYNAPVLLGNLFYGTSRNSIYEYNPLTNIVTTKFTFSNATLHGKDALGGLAFYNGKFYGCTVSGGSNNHGVIFEWDPTSNVFTKKIDFGNTVNASVPNGSLTLVDSIFYGCTTGGGINNGGVIFEWNPTTNVWTKKVDLGNSTSLPTAPYYGKLLLTYTNQAPRLHLTPSTKYLCPGNYLDSVLFKVSDSDNDSLTFEVRSKTLNDTSFSIKSLGDSLYSITFHVDSVEKRLDTIYVTIRDGYDAEKEFQFILIKDSVKSEISVMDNYCEGANNGSISLNVSGGMPPYNFYWNTGDTTANLTNLSKGQYSCIVKDQAGCMYTTDTINIKTIYSLHLDLGRDTFVCSNSYLDLDASNPGSSYVWSTGETTQTIRISDSGTYYVSITDQNGCFAIDTIYVSTFQAPSSVFTYVIDGQVVTFDGPNEPNATYSWDFGDGGTSIIDDPVHTYLTDGLFTTQLIATDTLTNCSSTFDAQFFIKPFSVSNTIIKQPFIYPNPFKDELHITFETTSSTELRVRIFDSFGKEVETLISAHVQEGKHNLMWDSNKKNPGVYFIRIDSSEGQFYQKVVLIK